MPTNKNTYIIGDIHGCIHTLRYLLYLQLKVEKTDTLYFMGDYIDRGPNSKAVLDEFIMLRNNGFEIHLLRGNHEQMMLDSLLSEKQHTHWVKNGGIFTLQSFKVAHGKDIPDKYYKMLETMDYYYELEEFFLVHGGMNFQVEDPFCHKDDMLWVRNDKIDKNKTKGKKIVVGHTPVSPAESYESLKSDIIMIDTGCIYKKIDTSLGYLTAFNPDTKRFYRAENMDT
jgi:serine/threonine protein phosphatase 1